MGLTIYSIPHLISYVSAINAAMKKSEEGPEARTAKITDHTYEGITCKIPSAYMSRIDTLSLSEYLSYGRLREK